MALVKFGGGVAAMSGKQAGNVYARNRAGAYNRQWTKPVNPSTIPQNDQRSAFANAVAAWMGLTAAQVDAWNALAASSSRTNRLGEPYTPTGRQLFIESSSNRALIGLIPLTVAPPTSLVPSVKDVAITAAAATANLFTALTVAWNFTGVGPNPSAPDNYVGIFGAPPHPAQRQNLNKLRRLVLVDAADTTPNSIQAAYNAYFGPVSTDGLLVDLWVKGIEADTGFASSLVKVTHVIT